MNTENKNMAICHTCSKEIANTASVCPHCGAEILTLNKFKEDLNQSMVGITIASFGLLTLSAFNNTASLYITSIIGNILLIVAIRLYIKKSESKVTFDIKKAYPLWKKIILFVPFFSVIIFTILLSGRGGWLEVIEETTTVYVIATIFLLFTFKYIMKFIRLQ